MKKRQILLLTCMVFLLVAQLVSAEDDFDSEIVHIFFQKVSTGEIDAIYSMLDDPLRSRLQTLLQENKEYKKTLIRKFSDSKIIVDYVSTQPTGNKIVAVSVYYQNGNRSNHKFIITRAGDSNWKISDEVVN